MKKYSFKVLSLILCIVMLSASLVSCGNEAKSLVDRYRAYDRTGESYDYDLTEYIRIPDCKWIEIPDVSFVPTEEDIANERVMKLAYFADEESVKEPAQKYDLVDADYSATLGDDETPYKLFDSTVDNSRRSFMVGTNHFEVPEIDDAIVGMAPGETKTIEFTLPRPYYKDVASSGMSGTFTITIDKVRRQDLPEYTDEFVQQYYGASGVEDYDDEIVEQLIHNHEVAYEGYEATLTWNYIVNNTRIIKYPGKELTYELDSVNNAYIRDAEKEEVTFDEFIKKNYGYNTTGEFFDGQVEPEARSIVTEYMIMFFIARSENITVSQQEYESALLEHCAYYGLTDVASCERAVTQEYGSVTAFKEIVLFGKVRDFVVNSAVKITPDEYYKNVDAGKYKLSDDEIIAYQTYKGEDSTAISFDTVIRVFLYVVGAALIALIVILVVKLVKAKKEKKEFLAEQAALEEKRRIRREMKQAKKKRH